MCSELTPRARIPDTRIPQLMQPCLQVTIFCFNTQQCKVFPIVLTYKRNPSEKKQNKTFENPQMQICQHGIWNSQHLEFSEISRIELFWNAVLMLVVRWRGNCCHHLRHPQPHLPYQHMQELCSQVPQPTCSWKWHPDTCQLGNPTRIMSLSPIINI